jgi:hypothetical protein
MDKRFNKKAEAYVLKYKNDLVEKIKEHNLDNEQMNKLLEYIYEYPRLTFDKEDFVKRKRVKNTIPTENRCSAKRACGQQCTRRKREGSEFCGTHFKNAPHGFMSDKEENSKKNIEVFTEDIKGIIYYIDNNSNVYKMEDVLEGKENPEIIAKYEKSNNVCSIIEFY